MLSHVVIAVGVTVHQHEVVPEACCGLDCRPDLLQGGRPLLRLERVPRVLVADAFVPVAGVLPGQVVLPSEDLDLDLAGLEVLDLLLQGLEQPPAF